MFIWCRSCWQHLTHHNLLRAVHMPSSCHRVYNNLFFVTIQFRILTVSLKYFNYQINATIYFIVIQRDSHIQIFHHIYFNVYIDFMNWINVYFNSLSIIKKYYLIRVFTFATLMSYNFLTAALMWCLLELVWTINTNVLLSSIFFIAASDVKGYLIMLYASIL